MCKISLQKDTKPYIYIYVELSFFLKMFRLQDRKNYVLSVVFTTRTFFWIFRVQDRDYKK